MNDLKYKAIAIYLIDTLCEIYNPNTVINMLVNSNVKRETLIDMGFSLDDIQTATNGK